MKRFLTETAVRYDPALPWFSEYKQPAIYKEWWKDIATCEGFDPLPDSVTSRIQFFQLNATSFKYDDSDDAVLAVSFMDDGQIYVGAPYIWWRNIIRHEMLHVILWYYGIRLGNFHPSQLFEACGLHRGGYQ